MDKHNHINNDGQAGDAMISVKHAAQWLAAMAAADGLVSPNERKLMKIFAERFGLDPANIYRMSHAIANEVSIPEVEAIDYAVKKGRMFEDFVVKLTADDNRFVRLNWSSDKFVDGLYSLDSLMPDLHIRHRLNSGEVVEYYIECKYRKSLPDGMLDLTQQLGRYRSMAIHDYKYELFILKSATQRKTRPLFLQTGLCRFRKGIWVIIPHITAYLPLTPRSVLRQYA